MSVDVKVKFMVMRNGTVVVEKVGDKGRFDTYELAENACRELAAATDGVMGTPPYFEIKKIFTV